MQWLNEIDKAIDRAVIGPRSRTTNDDDDDDDAKQQALVGKHDPGVAAIDTGKLVQSHQHGGGRKELPANLDEKKVLEDFGTVEWSEISLTEENNANIVHSKEKKRTDSEPSVMNCEGKPSKLNSNEKITKGAKSEITYQSWNEIIFKNRSTDLNLKNEGTQNNERNALSSKNVDNETIENSSRKNTEKVGRNKVKHVGLGTLSSGKTIRKRVVNAHDKRHETGKHFISQNNASPDTSARLKANFDATNAFPTWTGHEISTIRDSKTINCYGVIHVRVLRAQRLPCSVGSTVQAVVSLPPWKGCVRSEQAKSFLLDESFNSLGGYVQWNCDKYAPKVSMVHAYADKDTPIPSINVDLVLAPMKFLEFSMCSLKLPCDVLLRNPGNWRRQWFITSTKNTQNNAITNAKQLPLIELEAMFAAVEDTKVNNPVQVVSGLTPSKVSVRNNDQQVVVSNSASSTLLVKSKKSNQANIDSSTPSPAKSLSTKAHLLRLKTFWSPTNCCICSTIIMVGLKQGLYCEICLNEFCSDCRLHADLRMSCGSEKAKIALQKKGILSINKFLETMAPVNEMKNTKTENANKQSQQIEQDRVELTDGIEEGAGIGTLKLVLLEACVFSASLSALSDPEEVFGFNATRSLRRGDYYVRVCWTGGLSSARTHTIQNSKGKLKFKSSEMQFNVSNYGVEFRIEVIDATTDKPIGTGIITTQSLLQKQKERILQNQGFGVVQIQEGPPVFDGKSRLVLELRTGIKSGVSPDFSKTDDKTSASKSSSGNIVGWIELRAGIRENTERLYGPNPLKCLPRATGELNLSLLQNQLNRVAHLFSEIEECGKVFVYVVGWEKPALTSLSLIIFVMICLNFNPEYIGCLPFLFLLSYMLFYAWNRKFESAMNRFLWKEVNACREAEKEISMNYTLHRPLGVMRIRVRRGKNIVSLDGLPGKLRCRVYWDPLRYLNNSRKSSAVFDKSTRTSHDIGFTDSTYTLNPAWSKVEESDESRRLKQFLPRKGAYFNSPSDDKPMDTFQFPVLQPFKVTEEVEHGCYDGVLRPWTTSPGGVVIEVRFRDILSMFPGSDQVYGEVSIPFTQLIESGTISGWFRVFEVGTKRTIVMSKDKMLAEESKINDHPQIYLELQWTKVRSTDRETSIAIQEELTRCAVTANDGKEEQNNSTGTFDTLSGLSTRLHAAQHNLRMLLDFLESLRNALNYTDPFKSSVLLVVLCIPCLVLSCIPTRYLILAGGLGVYGAFFAERFLKTLHDHQLINSKQEKHLNEQTSTGNSESLIGKMQQSLEPILGKEASIWVTNALGGLPTDEDLRTITCWESHRSGMREREQHATRKREVRLRQLWKVEWFAVIDMLKSGDKPSSDDAENLLWEKVFGIVQGGRFLWWQNPNSFDEGEAPVGRIYFTGHAGLATPSPLEMRALGADQIHFVVIMFGKGDKDQERVTLLAPDLNVKKSLENAILGTLSTS